MEINRQWLYRIAAFVAAVLLLNYGGWLGDIWGAVGLAGFFVLLDLFRTFTNRRLLTGILVVWVVLTLGLPLGRNYLLVRVPRIVQYAFTNQMEYRSLQLFHSVNPVALEALEQVSALCVELERVQGKWMEQHVQKKILDIRASLSRSQFPMTGDIFRHFLVDETLQTIRKEQTWCRAVVGGEERPLTERWASSVEGWEEWVTKHPIPAVSFLVLLLGAMLMLRGVIARERMNRMMGPVGALVVLLIIATVAAWFFSAGGAPVKERMFGSAPADAAVVSVRKASSPMTPRGQYVALKPGEEQVLRLRKEGLEGRRGAAKLFLVTIAAEAAGLKPQEFVVDVAAHQRLHPNEFPTNFHDSEPFSARIVASEEGFVLRAR